MQVPQITFPTNQTAVVQMPSCRMASALRDFFFDRGYHMKSQSKQGKLTLRVPLAPFNTGGNSQNQDRVRTLFEEFCRTNGISIAKLAS